MAEETKCDYLLAIVVAERKCLGHVLVPNIIRKTENLNYTVLEQATPKVIAGGQYEFTPAEIDVIKTLNELSEQNLVRRFSKEKNINAFYDKLTDETIDKYIRPYIDKMLARALETIIENEIPVFLKVTGSSYIHETGRLTICHKGCRPRFFFTITPNKELSYTLKIDYNGEEFALINKKIIELSVNPAVLLIGRNLYCFRDIDSRKFRPFVNKNSIKVPARNVDQYMKTFVRNCIMHHYVSAYGFKILRRENNCKPILCVEQTIIGYAFRLYFAYGERRYAYNELTKRVDLEREDDNYIFYTCQRNSEAEENIATLLHSTGLKSTTNGNFTFSDETDCTNIHPLIEWINNNRNKLKQNDIAIEICEEKQYYDGSIDLQMTLKEENDWFDIGGTIILDGCEIPFMKLRRNIIEHNREYVMPDGRIFVLPEEWFTAWSDVMAFGREKDQLLEVRKIHSSLLPNDIIHAAKETTSLITISKTERIGQLDATLRPYQEDGFRWMNTLYENHLGGILADDMGLGKTIQTIALLSHIYAGAPKQKDAVQDTLFDNLFNDTIYPPSLIMVPVSLIHNWKNELSRFAPHLRIYVYIGKNRLRTSEIGRILRHYHVILTSYGLARNDSEILSTYKFHYLILDESQYIKNPDSKIYKAVMELQADYRLTITGTPIENSLSDLWAQLNFTNPGLLGNRTFFRRYFETPILKGEEKQKEKLRRLTSPFILRRTKEMVARELPPVTYQTIYCDMTEEQNSVYEREKSGVRNEILNLTHETSGGKENFAALQALTRLRLIANHPKLTDKDFQGSSGKTERVMSLTEDIIAEGHKILVFSSFVRDLNLFAAELTERNIGYSMLTGGTHDRENVIKEFSTDSEKKIFLISLKAGGVGLNLTVADYVFMLNPWWNPQAESQAISRAHRIGQTKSVFVYRFITTNTIEEKIARLQEKKQSLASDFITEHQGVSAFTLEELKELISEN